MWERILPALPLLLLFLLGYLLRKISFFDESGLKVQGAVFGERLGRISGPEFAIQGGRKKGARKRRSSDRLVVSYFSRLILYTHQ